MSQVTLDASGAAELAELLQFLTGWLARDPARLATSLEQFAGNPADNIGQLHQDLARFTFLPGGSDGEPPSAHDKVGLPGQPRLRRAVRASTSFVLALARCGRCTLTPATAPAFSGTYPGDSQHTNRPRFPQPDGGSTDTVSGHAER